MTRTIYTDKDSVPMKIYTGVRNYWTLTVTNDDGTVLNATGYTFACQVRDKPGGKLLATMAWDITDIATGVLIMEITKANSLLMGERSGVYDVLQLETADATNVLRLYGGAAEITPVVTEV